jgi:hypothetical protein
MKKYKRKFFGILKLVLLMSLVGSVFANTTITDNIINTTNNLSIGNFVSDLNSFNGNINLTYASGNAAIVGNLTLDKINSSNGLTEVHLQDQNLRTNDNVSFINIYTTSASTERLAYIDSLNKITNTDLFDWIFQGVGLVITDNGNGSVTLDINAQVDQNVNISSSPTFVGQTLSSLNVLNGIIRTDGSGVLSSSTDLPDGTTGTTQSADDNSTKLSTTEYVDNAVAGFTNVWDRITGTPNYLIPTTASDDIGATGARITKIWSTDSESTNAPTVSGAAVYYSGGTDVSQADGGTGIDSSGVTDGQILIGNSAGNVWNLATISPTASETTITNGGGTIQIGLATGIDVINFADGSVDNTEFQQIGTIGSTTISATQWGYVGGADQPVKTTDNVQFNQATLGNTGLVVGASTPFSDSTGTLTLQTVDVIDSTTETTIETALDTLPNVNNIQSQSVSLSGSLTVESASTVNQDLTTDATGVTFGSMGTTDFDGAITATVDDNDNYVGLTITNNDVTNNPNLVNLVNEGTGISLNIDQNGNGKGIVITSDATSANLFQIDSNGALTGGSAVTLIRSLNSSTTLPALTIQQEGTSNSMFINHNNAGASNALRIDSAGTSDDILVDSGAKLTAAGVWTDAPSKSWYKTPLYKMSVLPKIMELNMDVWEYKDEEFNGYNRYSGDKNKHTGVYQDEFYEIFEVGDNNSLNPQDQIGILYKAIQEQQVQIEELNNRIYELEGTSEETYFGMFLGIFGI